MSSHLSPGRRAESPRASATDRGDASHPQGHATNQERTWLQFPTPAFVTDRARKKYRVPRARPYRAASARTVESTAHLGLLKRRDVRLEDGERVSPFVLGSVTVQAKGVASKWDGGTPGRPTATGERPARAHGKMERKDGAIRFVDVLLRPRVTLAAGADRAKAQALHANAHHECFIANSVNFPVRNESEIVEAGPA